MSHKTTVHIADLHFDLRVWSNELKFFKEEIGIFEHRLEELVSKNTAKEMLAELEHFQNQFIRQNEAADEMAKKVREADALLAQFAQEHTVATDRVRMDDHVGLREEMESYRSRYQGIKVDFQRFSAKWM
jgi:hypothetical protein